MVSRSSASVLGSSAASGSSGISRRWTSALARTGIIASLVIAVDRSATNTAVIACSLRSATSSKFLTAVGMLNLWSCWYSTEHSEVWSTFWLRHYASQSQSEISNPQEGYTNLPHFNDNNNHRHRHICKALCANQQNHTIVGELTGVPVHPPTTSSC